MRAFLLILFILVLSANAFCQAFQITGTVTDEATGAPLAFVNIVANQGKAGTSSDIDGRFTISSKEPVRHIRFSYVGYEPVVIEAESISQPLLVKMKSTITNLAEIEVRPGENPAHRIIKRVTANRDRNNPEKLSQFSYSSYNKLVVTAVPGEANMADTMSLSAKPDSTEMELRKLLEKQHLFVMETITRRNFMAPGLSKEVVMASRTSGFKTANIAFLATNLQPFSLYNEFIPLSGYNYLNPISQGSTRKYDFLLQDTTYSGADTVFIISFKPSKGKNFEGLKGLLYINSDGWALQNIIAEPVQGDLKGLRIQQKYEKIDGRQWFPVQLNTDFVIPNVQAGKLTPTAISRSYITNINLNPGLRKRDFNAVTVEVQPMAHSQPDELWQRHRADSLDIEEITTYQVLDSLGEKHNFDRKLKIFESLISGRYPLGYVDFDITRLLNANRYEGLRLGAGLYTSERVSKFFTVGGYGAYGFRDKGFKYGADATFFLYRPAALELLVAWSEDIKETGGVNLPFRNRNILENKLRYLVIDNMDKVETKSAFLRFRTLRYLSVITGLRQEYRRTTNGYEFEKAPDQFSSRFRFTEGVVGVRYALREQVVKTGNRQVSMGTAFPVLWLQYTRGLQGPFNGQYAYNKYDARLQTSYRTVTFGLTQVELAAGLADGNIPYTNLYNGNGSFSNSIRIYASEGFETMAPGEFANDRYAVLYLKHGFGKLLFRSEKFSPHISIATNIGFGSLRNPNSHRIVTEHGFERLKTMEKGYYESGLIVNDILKSSFSSIGLSVFGRYGAYQKPKPIDNLTLKISFAYTL